MRHWLIGAGLAGTVLALAGGFWAAAPPAEAQQEAPRFRRHVIAFGNVMNGVAVADFNGDGRLDAAAAGPEEVVWYARTLGSSFWKPHPIHARSSSTGSVDSICLLAYDMDGDGDPDLIASTPGTGDLVWYENPLDPEKPWTRHLIDRLPKIHSQALEDLNRDGRPELVANTDGAIVWYAIPRHPRGILPASYSGDAAGRPIWERKYLARSGVPGTPHYLNFGDVDGDGNRDLLTGAPDAGYLAWWERPEDGTLLWSRHIHRADFPGATHFLPADLDQDGRQDLFFARGHTSGWGWLSGEGWTKETVGDPGTLPEPHALALADLDGDGRLDVVGAGRHSGGVVAWVNRGGGRFTRHQLDPDQTGMDLKVVDLDGDGDMDILIAGAGGKNVAWLENLRL